MEMPIIGVYSVCHEMDPILPTDGLDVGTVMETQRVETRTGHRSLHIVAGTKIYDHIGIHSRLPEPDHYAVTQDL